MSRRFLLAGMLVVGAVALLAWPANGIACGQEPQAASSGGEQLRDASTSDQTEASREGLEAILRNWALESSRLETLQGDFHRWVYNQAFRRIDESSGHFWYLGPDKKRIDSRPGSVGPGARVSVDGNDWQRFPDREEQWLADGQRLLRIFPDEQAYEELPIHSERLETYHIFAPADIARRILPPFLLGLKVDEWNGRYELRFGAKHDTMINVGLGPQRVYHMVVYPSLASDKAYFQRAEVMLDPETFLPISIKLVDPAAGDRNRQETVYLFRDVKVNEMYSTEVDDPFTPDLTGLQNLMELQKPAMNGAAKHWLAVLLEQFTASTRIQNEN